MSFIISGLESVDTFFSDELNALESFTNFLATDVVNFFNTVVTDLENSISTIAQWISDIPTAMQNFANYAISVLQNVVNALNPAIQAFIQFFEGLLKNAFSFFSSIATDFVNGLYSFSQTIGNTFAQITQSILGDFLNMVLPAFSHISSAGQQLLQFFTPFISPITLSKVLPAVIEKLSDLIPEIELDLSPMGLGGKTKIDFGALLEKFSETVIDFFTEIRNEAIVALKDSIKEPFISDLKITLREIFNEIGLGDIPFADPRFADIKNWIAVRSFEELKDHFKETLLLTGFPAWFTDAYLQPPVDDYIPRNPLFKPIAIRDVIQAVQYNFLQSDAISKYAYNNLITPKTAQLMYKNQTARLVQRAVEQGLRQFVYRPDEAIKKIQDLSSKTGNDLLNDLFSLEYNIGEQRFAKQILRSLLSRALSNFGRPYIDTKFLQNLANELEKELGYGKNVSQIFQQMIQQSQLIQYNQLLFSSLQKQVNLGIFDEKSLEKELKDNNFNVGFALSILTNDFNQLLIKTKTNAILSLAKLGYISQKDAEKELTSLGLNKSYVDVELQYIYKELETKANVSYIQYLLKNLLISERDAEHQLESLGLDKNYVKEIVSEAVTEQLAKLKLNAVESQIKVFYYKESEIKNLLQSAGIAKDYADILAQIYYNQYTKNEITKLIIQNLEVQLQNLILDQTQFTNALKALGLDTDYVNTLYNVYYNRYIVPKIANYYVSLARHGILQKPPFSSKLFEDYELNLALKEYEITLYEQNIRSNLQHLLITPQNAIAELKKIGLNDSIAQLFVSTYSPILYNINNIIRYIIEGKIYNVGKVPINTAGIESELRKLGIPDNQIPIIINEYSAQIGLQLWQKYLPSLSDIESAIQYNYPTSKLIQLALIPSELLNLKIDIFQQRLAGQLVHSLQSDYVNLLMYNYSNLSQLENLMAQYGFTNVMFSILKISAQLKKILTMYQELYITPSKALTISEYVSNPTQFLQKVFTEFNVPNDLQNTYLEYARNRRLSKYVSEIITTINLLFERHKIDLNTALQYLNQLKQYGLTDEEIQLIQLNWQLRSAY